MRVRPATCASAIRVSSCGSGCAITGATVTVLLGTCAGSYRRDESSAVACRGDDVRVTSQVDDDIGPVREHLSGAGGRPRTRAEPVVIRIYGLP